MVKIKEAETDPNHRQNIAGITAQATIDLTEIVQGHRDGTETTPTEAIQGNPTQHTGDTVAGHTMTHCISHIRDHPNITSPQGVDPEIIEVHTHDHPTDL